MFATAEIALWNLPQAIAAGVVVSGQVRNDLNSNGDIYESDSGISGVTVTLYQDDGAGNATGPAIATATTDSSGNYSFSGIAVGNYIIVETNPTNYVSSGDSQGTNDDKIAVSVGSFDKTGNIFLDVNTTLLDYGDAPNTYGTLLASSGARHTRNGTLYLGSGVTGEADGQPGTTATTDANDDGVTFSPSLGPNYSALIQSGVTNTITVVSSGSGFLNAWVDYNQDGDFSDSGEQFLT
ncbi:MAG: SdrD B-like domain-containing protein, partial [Thermosynechococcaceae cyanobacterium]